MAELIKVSEPVPDGAMTLPLDKCLITIVLGRGRGRINYFPYFRQLILVYGTSLPILLNNFTFLKLYKKNYIVLKNMEKSVVVNL